MLVIGHEHTDNQLTEYNKRKGFTFPKVKRLKSTIFNSGSAAANTSLTVFLPSMISSWFNQANFFQELAQTTFRDVLNHLFRQMCSFFSRNCSNDFFCLSLRLQQ